MTIVVCVKQVGLLGDEIEFGEDGRSIDLDFLEPSLNEWDAYAIEEALRLRDALGGEVVAITCGDEEADAVLRRAFAMGVDRGIRIDADLGFDALAPAQALAEAVRAQGAKLVLCGAQSGDASFGATPSALAGLLDMPIAAVVRQIELDPAGASVTVHRELEGGLVDVVEVDLPAVVSVQTGINEPRYATLRAIRQAEERDVEVQSWDGPASSSVDTMRVPERSTSATMIEGSAAEVAQHIAALVRERLA